MRILLINPPNCGRSIPEERYGITSLKQIFRGEPLGLEELAGNLPEHEVRLLDLKADPDSLDAELERFRPEMVGITGVTCEANTMLALASAVKAKLAATLVEDGIGILEKTIEAKKTDGGLAVYLNPGEVTVVAGGGIVGGDKLNKLIKQLVDELKKSDPDSAEIVKLNAETVDKVSFHTAAIPSSDEEMTRIRALGKAVHG